MPTPIGSLFPRHLIPGMTGGPFLHPELPAVEWIFSTHPPGEMEEMEELSESPRFRLFSRSPHAHPRHDRELAENRRPAPHHLLRRHAKPAIAHSKMADGSGTCVAVSWSDRVLVGGASVEIHTGIHSPSVSPLRT
jgi:hypothetical protein